MRLQYHDYFQSPAAHAQPTPLPRANYFLRRAVAVGGGYAVVARLALLPHHR